MALLLPSEALKKLCKTERGSNDRNIETVDYSHSHPLDCLFQNIRHINK